MSVKIIFVIGGARSGKSSFALNKAAEIKGPRAYIATGEALDDEMKERIKQHREDRGSDWDTYEEPLNVPDVLSNIDKKYNTIVIECLTLWLSNVMIRIKSADKDDNPPIPPLEKGGKGGFENVKKDIQEFINMLLNFKNSSYVTTHASNLFIVSNEVGMGIVPENPLAREFRDLAGFLNQRIAEVADDVYMVTAGIPVKIK